MIYFIKMGDLDYVKIGYTDSVARRMRNYKYNWPVNPVLLHSMEGDRKTEYGIHRHLEHHRVADRAEWFHDSPHLRAFIGCPIGFRRCNADIRRQPKPPRGKRPLGKYASQWLMQPSQERNDAIMSAIRAGETWAVISKRFRVSTATVYRVNKSSGKYASRKRNYR